MHRLIVYFQIYNMRLFSFHEHIFKYSMQVEWIICMVGVFLFWKAEKTLLWLHKKS